MTRSTHFLVVAAAALSILPAPIEAAFLATEETFSRVHGVSI